MKPKMPFISAGDAEPGPGRLRTGAASDADNTAGISAGLRKARLASARRKTDEQANADERLRLVRVSYSMRSKSRPVTLARISILEGGEP